MRAYLCRLGLLLLLLLGVPCLLAQVPRGTPGLFGTLTVAGTSGTTLVVDTNTLVVDATNHRVGIATPTPSTTIGLGGTAARTIALERHTTSDTAGQSLSITAGGATSGATNKAGGDLNLAGGLSTGSGVSRVRLRAYGNTAGSTSDNSLNDILVVGVTGIEIQGQLAAANTTFSYPALYNTSTAGAAYPFLTAGNLVLQSRASGANRDIVFITNTTPTVQGGFLGTGGLYVGPTPPTTSLAKAVSLNGIPFAALGTPDNGTIAYCSDCTVANPCAGSGTGALAKRLNGSWVCN